MTSGACEKEMRRTRTPRLDDATTQAVLDLQKALRAVKRLERVDLRALSPAAMRDHHDRLGAALRRFRDARLGLEGLLEEDA